MIDYIKNFQYNGILGILLYWVPLCFCIVGYFMRTWRNYRQDLKDRADPTRLYYHPTDKLGTLIGRAIITILPFGNLCASIFDLAPYVFGKFFHWLAEVFDQPLVPDTDEAEARRKATKVNRS